MRSIKHLENEKIIPNTLVNENQSSASKQKLNKIYNPLKLTPIARDKIKKNEVELNRETAKKCKILTILKIKISKIF